MHIGASSAEAVLFSKGPIAPGTNFDVDVDADTDAAVGILK